MPDPAEGSSRHRADCGHDVWLAPSGRKTLARHGPMLLCSACAEGFLRNDPDIEIGVAPDQLPEIGDELRRRGLLPE